MDADVIVVGAGLAGLVATAELADAGRKVILLDQEPEASLGGQAFWSLGGLFLVDTPEQRRLRIKDSRELAWQDWLGTAGFDRAEDEWPRRWAEAYVDFAAGEKRAWLAAMGVRFLPNVGWAERGGYVRDRARQLGAALPHHVGHRAGRGRAVRAPRARGGRARAGRAALPPPVDELTITGGAVDRRARRRCSTPSGAVRGAAELARGGRRVRAASAQAVIVTSGGIGGNHELVRATGRERLGTPPKSDDLRRARPRRRADARRSPQDAGGNVDQPRPHVALRRGHPQLGPDLDQPRHPHPPRARRRCGSTRPARRLPVPLFPGFDTLGTLAHIMQTGHDHTWFVLTQKIIEKEFALSGSEQNPDITGKSVREVLRGARRLRRARAGPGVHGPRRRLRRRARPGARSCAG